MLVMLQLSSHRVVRFWKEPAATDPQAGGSVPARPLLPPQLWLLRISCRSPGSWPHDSLIVPAVLTWCCSLSVCLYQGGCLLSHHAL